MLFSYRSIVFLILNNAQLLHRLPKKSNKNQPQPLRPSRGTRGRMYLIHLVKKKNTQDESTLCGKKKKKIRAAKPLFVSFNSTKQTQRLDGLLKRFPKLIFPRASGDQTCLDAASLRCDATKPALFTECASRPQPAVPRSASTAAASLPTGASAREAGEATTVPAV